MTAVYPRLAPWAAFFRRFAACVLPLPALRSVCSAFAASVPLLPVLRGFVALADLDFFVDQALVGFVAAGQFEGVRQDSFSVFHTCDHVGAAEPVSFGEVGLRPFRGMVGVGMVEADNVFSAFAAFTLDADQFARVDAVAVVGGVGAGVAAGGGRGHDFCAVVIEAAKED